MKTDLQQAIDELKLRETSLQAIATDTKARLEEIITIRMKLESLHDKAQKPVMR